MGLFSRLRKVSAGVVKARMSGDDGPETPLDALAEAELEAEISGVWTRPTLKAPVLAGAKPAHTLAESAAQTDAAVAEATVAEATVVQGPAGKRSL